LGFIRFSKNIDALAKHFYLLNQRPVFPILIENKLPETMADD